MTNLSFSFRAHLDFLSSWQRDGVPIYDERNTAPNETWHL